MDTSGDDQIIAEVLGGNVSAFGVLVNKYQRPVYSLMLRVTGAPDQAEDLAQDAFIRAYDKLDLFRPGRPFLPWLCKIAMNLARDFLRKNRRELNILDDERNPGLEPSQEPEVETRFDQWTEMERLTRALNQLPWDYREALILRFKQDFRIKDVAKTLNISLSGAKMRIHRGLKRLRTILSQD